MDAAWQILLQVKVRRHALIGRVHVVARVEIYLVGPIAGVVIASVPILLLLKVAGPAVFIESDALALPTVARLPLMVLVLYRRLVR